MKVFKKQRVGTITHLEVFSPFSFCFSNRVEWMAWLENWNLQKMEGIPMCILKFWGQTMEKILAEASARWGYIYSTRDCFFWFFSKLFLCSMLIEKHWMADNMVFCIIKGVRDGRKALNFEIFIYFIMSNRSWSRLCWSGYHLQCRMC